MLSEGNTTPFLLLTWGSLSRAFYNAVANPKNAENVNIIESVKRGISNVCVLTSNMPDDAVEYVRDYHNGFNGGAKEIFIQKLRDVEEIEHTYTAWFS